MSYPVFLDVERPQKYERMQVLIRLLILAVLSGLGGFFGWSHGLIFLLIPLAAAVLISQRGAAEYLAESGGKMMKWLGYVAGFFAYMSLLTDKLPLSDEGREAVRYSVQPEGAPSTGKALLRIITVIPHVIVLAILGIVSTLLAILAAVWVLVSESYPKAFYDFQLGYNRWYARVLAYAGSLVDDYPPFSFGDGADVAALPPGNSQPV